MRRLLPLALLATLSACGMQPLYSSGTQGAVATTLGDVSVSPIQGRAGWLVKNALDDKLDALGGSNSRFQLQVVLDDQITGFGLLANDQVTRERRTLRARYQLVETATGDVVLDATAASDAGIDIVSSEYATIAAENRALENLSLEIANQIVTRLSLFAREVSQAQ
jgi:LPS-assembly lipoprotein